MSKQDQLNSAIQRLGAATDEIASDLTKLRAEITAGTISDESLSALDSNIARLEAMGQDPENPIPGEDATGGEAGSDDAGEGAEA